MFIFQAKIARNWWACSWTAILSLFRNKNILYSNWKFYLSVLDLISRKFPSSKAFMKFVRTGWKVEQSSASAPLPYIYFIFWFSALAASATGREDALGRSRQPSKAAPSLRSTTSILFSVRRPTFNRAQMRKSARQMFFSIVAIVSWVSSNSKPLLVIQLLLLKSPLWDWFCARSNLEKYLKILKDVLFPFKIRC